MQQYHLFAQVRTTNGNLTSVSFSGFGQNLQALTAYIAHSVVDVWINSGHIANYINTVCLNLTNLRVCIMYFKAILRIIEHLFHPEVKRKENKLFWGLVMLS